MSAATRRATDRDLPTRRDDVDPTPWPLALLLAAAGGVCALAAFPPYDLWMLLPVSFALFSAALLVRTARLALLVSLVWGLTFFVPLTQWASTYAGVMPWIALGVFEALYMVVYGLAARAVMVRRGLTVGTAVVVAALWTAVELLRGTFPWGGLTWGSAAFALGDSPLLNLGPWIGMSGLAFVTALLGQLLVHGALSLLGRRHRGLVGFAGVWPLAVAVAAVLATVITPYPANRAPEGRPTMRIAGVQGSMERIDPATMAMPDDVFANHLETTYQLIEDAAADGTQLALIVWPEDSTGYDPRQDPWMAQQIADASAAAGAPILIGTQSAVGETQRLNESVLYTPDGDVAYTYAKRHPVPFGEYVPFRDFFRTLTDKVDLISRDMLPGQEVGVMDLGELDQGEGSVGVLICFEIAYQDLVGDVADDGAEVIVVQSNNALFGDSHEAIQQLAEAKVMAVISGRSVVHVSTVGQSAIFTPEGRQLDYVEHWEQSTVVADVPLRTGTTVAVAAGPWIGIGISAVAVLGLLGALTGSRRALAKPRPRPHRSART